jgi:hypothetical protein
MKTETMNPVLVFRASKGFLLLLEPIHLTEKLTIFRGSLSKKNVFLFTIILPLAVWEKQGGMDRRTDRRLAVIYMVNHLTLSPRITPSLYIASGKASDEICAVSVGTYDAGILRLYEMSRSPALFK